MTIQRGDSRSRTAEHGDLRSKDPGAIPPLLWRFERPCSNDFSQRRQDADVAARLIATDSKSERGTTGRTQGLGRIRRSGSHKTGLWAPSVRAPAAMRWSAGAAGATLARDCERDGGGGGSEGRGRSGRRQSRRQWAGRFSSQRTRSDREGRCERDQAGSESTTRIPPYCVLW